MAQIELKNIETLLLDMDGTLLDLHFDTHFWMEHLPKQYAKKHNLDEEKATIVVHDILNKMQGTLQWYCIDYWSDIFDMPIAELKQEVAHLIQVHSFVIDFLKEAKTKNKKIYLITNAHPKVIEKKMVLTKLDVYFDKIISSHNLGIAKEHKDFWQVLEKEITFDKNKACFFDDSLNVLNKAKDYGLQSIAISKPSSQLKKAEVEGFVNIESFSQVILL
jgi:putative hydrolase of the HAD superfamily